MRGFNFNYECDCPCCGSHIVHKSLENSCIYAYKGVEVVRHVCNVCGFEFLVKNNTRDNSSCITSYNKKDLICIEP